ncbi:unnamed protein product [Didymodactylos carnosus]|uniref:Uncharacterized protein n=2 Tax=Didymodactylos carnosus TaxID=1234261 RepID=A0A816A0K6_9BILA|nr:unnamed protein product [Didymodactylos carnosus]CAF4460996.1 unnamed protein product [Didymodactylos carnosus]
MPPDPIFDTMTGGETILGNSSRGCGVGTRQLCSPTDIFMTSTNHLYIVDSGNRRIQKYNLEDQSVETVIGSVKLREPISVYVVGGGTDEEIYVLDRVNRTDFVVKLWKNKNDIDGTIVIPSDSEIYYDLYLDGNSNIYLSTYYEIKKWFAPDYGYGIIIAQFHSQENSVPIYVDEDYNLYFYDCAEPEIQMWPIGGAVEPSFKRTFASLRSTETDGPIGFTLDCNNNIYFSVRVNKSHYAIFRVNQQVNGKIETVLLNPSYISAIQFDQYGNLYVSGRQEHQIRKFAVLN